MSEAQERTSQKEDSAINQAVNLFVYGGNHSSDQAAPFAQLKSKLDRNQKRLCFVHPWSESSQVKIKNLEQRLEKIKQEIILHPQFQRDMEIYEKAKLTAKSQRIKVFGIFAYLLP